MAYPQAPWKLQGYGIQTLQLVDIERSRPFIPPELEIISVLPGKTLGGVYVAAYESGSILQYNELIVVAAMVKYADRFGGWISHIYVDNPDSVAGGREIWGLPKELAEFTWQKNDRHSQVTIRQSDRLLCSLNYNLQNFGLPLPITGSFLSILNSKILSFQGNLKFQMSIINSKLEIPAESPFASLNLAQAGLAFCLNKMQFIACPPEIIGYKN